MPDHVLKDDESLVTVARQDGFGKWETIFDDGGNSALKSKRGHANALMAPCRATWPRWPSKR